MLRAISASAFILMLPASAFAEVELSFYGGLQSAQDSDVSIRDDDVIADSDFTQEWEGRATDAPPYYGIRATKWQSRAFGYGVDLAHNQAGANNDTLPDGVERLEFADSLNTLTVNAYRRWAGIFGEVTPYVGGGLGLSAPNVDVTTSAADTSGYQLTGPAATWLAGASYPINDQWAVFGEYKGTYSSNTADLDTGGTLETDIVTNAVNLGLSFNF